MKPFRVKMTDTLVKSYGMHEKLENIEVDEDFIENVDLTKFHSDDYIDCLRNISIAKKHEYIDQIHRFTIGTFAEDCPVFDNMLDYCQRYTAGSLQASSRITP
jgi:histone deacetylase 1/2